MLAKVRVLVVAAMLGLAGCASTPAESEHAAAPSAATVQAVSISPRPECAPAHVTLYFTEQVSSDEPVVTPLLNDFMARIRGCQAAGGELRAITIATTADAGQSAAEARAQIHRRQERVRAALVNAGAPADKITTAAESAHEGAVMSRRAEITADLY